MQSHDIATMRHPKHTWLARATIAFLVASALTTAADARVFFAVNVAPYRPAYYAPAPVYYAPGPAYYAPYPRYYSYSYPRYYYPRHRYSSYSYPRAHVHRARVAVIASARTAPPPLPVYQQPSIPGPGYVWTPGYWGYGGDGYYWVAGAWVLPPYAGALWTPGYWGLDDGVYAFSPGYWDLSVGYYGGIAYGFGYPGIGYDGGYWNLGVFYYNSGFNNFGNVRITNVYNRSMINNFRAVASNITANRASFNGPRGVTTRPTAQQLAFAQQRHTGAVGAQIQQRTFASRDASMRSSVNHGTPPIAATQRAGAFGRSASMHAALAQHPMRTQAMMGNHRLASMQPARAMNHPSRMPRTYSEGPRSNAGMRFAQPPQGHGFRAESAGGGSQHRDRRG